MDGQVREVTVHDAPEVAAANPEPAPAATSGVSETEAKVDEVLGVASQIAAPFLHSVKAVGALAAATNLSPIAIHLGFLLAHLFHHYHETTAKK